MRCQLATGALHCNGSCVPGLPASHEHNPRPQQCVHAAARFRTECVKRGDFTKPYALQSVNDAGRLRLPAAAATAHLDDPGAPGEASPRPPPPPDMRRIMACAMEVAEAMRYLHSRDMMHGAWLSTFHGHAYTDVLSRSLLSWPPVYTVLAFDIRGTCPWLPPSCYARLEFSCRCANGMPLQVLVAVQGMCSLRGLQCRGPDVQQRAAVRGQERPPRLHDQGASDAAPAVVVSHLLKSSARRHSSCDAMCKLWRRTDLLAVQADTGCSSSRPHVICCACVPVS